MLQISRYRDSTKRAVLVFALAVLVRVVISLPFEWEDQITDSYEVIAINLLSGNGFSYNGTDPTVCRMPAYPMWLSFLLFIFGQDPIPYTALRVGEVLIDSLTAVLVLQLMSTWFPNLGSSQVLGAGVAHAVNPFAAYYSVKLGSETLATISLVLFLIAFNRAFAHEKPKVGAVLSAGVLAGFLILNKSVFIPVVLVLPVLSLLVFRAIPLKRFAGLFILFTWVTALVVAPWVLRNFQVTQGKLVFQTLSGFNFWHDFSLDRNRNKAIMSEDWGAPYRGDPLFVEDGVRYAHYDLAAPIDAKYDRIMVSKAIQWIRSNPTSFLLKVIDNILAFWYQLETPQKMLVGGFFSLSSLSIALFSMRLFAAKGHLRRAIFFLSIVFLVNIVYSPILAVFRYSLVVHPLLLALVGSFVFEIVDNLRRKATLVENNVHPDSRHL